MVSGVEPQRFRDRAGSTLRGGEGAPWVIPAARAGSLSHHEQRSADDR